MGRRGLVRVEGSVRRTDGENGLLGSIELTHESGASARVYPFGADVTSFVDASGTEWIAVRPDAKLDGSKPISGDLSHCFPQFGPGPIQQHGFGRNVDWKMGGFSERGASPSVSFILEPSAYTREIWDEPFRCEFVVTLNANSLDTKLVVRNVGDQESSSFEFQAALHSYFDCSDIGALKVGGSFEGASYLDKLATPPETRTESRAQLEIAEPYDRIYSGVNDPELNDPAKPNRLKIVNRQGWKDTVVWSPYGDDGMGYKRFVCVESAALDPVRLEPGAEWVGEMSLEPASA